MASSGSASLGTALVAVNLVTIRTHIVQFFTDIAERVKVPRSAARKGTELTRA